MKKLNIAIIGQGRSGRDIHGRHLKSPANEHFTVKYVVEADAERRVRAEAEYPGCRALTDYRELFELKDVDLVVNASYSYDHYPVSRDLVDHGFNVLCEKPMCRTRAEADDIIALAKERGVMLAVFQQSFFAPFVKKAYEVMHSGIIGEVKQINLRYNGFSRRWDWQTVQKCCAGGTYNTGPHPIGLALGFLDFDPEAKLAFSRLGTAMTSGDGDDCAKLILTAPGRPLVDVEINSNDPYATYTLKMTGTRGAYMCNTGTWYKMKYYTDEENPAHEVIFESLKTPEGLPTYCREQLVTHEEEGSFEGNAFDIGTAKLYANLYGVLNGTEELIITPEMGREIVGICEDAYKETPLPVLF